MYWVEVEVVIKFKDDEIMRWTVSGEIEVCAAVESSPGWRRFLEWRDSISRDEWRFVTIEETLLSDKKNE